MTTTSVTMPTLRMPIRLQRHQWEAWNSEAPFRVLLTGLGGGKTWTGARWILCRAIAYPESIHLVTINTFPQARDTVLPALDDAIEDLGLEAVWSSRTVQPTLFINVGSDWAEIRVRSTEKPNSLRGPEYGSWWADEIRDAKLAAIPVALGRLRCKKVNRPEYLWTTSPNGFDFIHERHAEHSKVVRRFAVRGLNGEPQNVTVWRSKDGERGYVHAETAANRFVHKDYVNHLNRNMDPIMALQERGGQFVNFGGRIYYRFDRNIHVHPAIKYNPKHPLNLSFDFNMDPMAAVLIQDYGTETHVVDEFFLRDSDVPEVIEEFLGRYRSHKGPLTIFGDSAGHTAGATAGQSDYDTMKKMLKGVWNGPVLFNVPTSNPLVIDRIKAVNLRFRGVDEKVRLWLSSKCVELRKDLEQVAPKKGTRQPDKSKDRLRTHISDALGYFVFRTHPIYEFDPEKRLMKRSHR